MQWLLTAVVLGAACWMVSALTYEDEGAAAAPSRLLDAGRDSLPRVAAAGRTTILRWLQATRSALIQFAHVAGPLLLTAGRATATVTIKGTKTVATAIWWVLRMQGMAFGVSRPTFSASARRPSALSRLLALIQLVFLVVLWGSGAALAIAGAAWAVTRIV